MNHLHQVQAPSAKPPGVPIWYNEQGRNMAQQQPNAIQGGQSDLLFGKGVTAMLSIRQIGRRPHYAVGWRVHHAGGLEMPHTGGKIECSAGELRCIFGLDDNINDESGLWFIGRYGGTVAVQGKFLRWGPYLNIPGPGTGRNGDPNISVYVSNEIKQAVQSMLEKHSLIKA